jgi:hypothetical protein
VSYLPDLREVIDSLIGKSNKLFPNGKMPIGFQWFGLRQTDFTEKCGCTPIEGTSENHTCSRCMNTGYIFTDHLVKGFSWMGLLGVEYSANPGLLSTQQKNVVLEYARPINKFDYILELDYDPKTNKVRQPFRIAKYNRIQDSTPIKGDHARIEFWKCSVEERNIKDGRAASGGTGFNLKGDITANGHFGFRAT